MDRRPIGDVIPEVWLARLRASFFFCSSSTDLADLTAKNMTRSEGTFSDVIQVKSVSRVKHTRSRIAENNALCAPASLC